VRRLVVARLLAIAAFAVAFVGLDGLASSSFAWHMTQHMTLVVVLAPLLVLGWAPRRVPRGLGGVWFAIVAVSAQTTAIVLWHFPVPFDAAAAHIPLHVLEHLTLLATAVAAWWVILMSPAGAAVRFVTCAAVAAPMVLLGAFLTLAPSQWYTAAHSLTDQQTGGAIMWGPAGIAYVIAAAWIVASAITADERFAATRAG
jgi:putative membrane protein